MTWYTPPWERSPHDVVAPDSAVRNASWVGSREYYVILLQVQDNITGRRGIAIDTVNKGGSDRLTVEGYFNWHVLTR